MNRLPISSVSKTSRNLIRSENQSLLYMYKTAMTTDGYKDSRALRGNKERKKEGNERKQVI